MNFPMFAKIDVNGKNAHEVFKYLRSECPDFNYKSGKVKEIPWNFCKFILNKEGKFVRYLNPKESIFEARTLIEELLADES